MKKKQNKRLSRLCTLTSIITLFIGLGLGLMLSPHPKTLSLAPESDINNAYQTITQQYFYSNKVLCPPENVTMSDADALAYFNKYLKVNGYANRAVVRFCVKSTSYSDVMLAKAKNGSWILTDLNMNLNTRVNPKWQKECLIQDITTPDTIVRPENISIDSLNYLACKKLLSD